MQYDCRIMNPDDPSVRSADEAALLAAIRSQPDEDTPRLAYADWLDENEAPIQAEFIRLQCRLASGSAADADYPDTLERYAEVAARFQVAAPLTAPKLPPGFACHDSLAHEHDNFRRGFLYTASDDWTDEDYYYYEPLTDQAIDSVCAGLAQLVAETTVRNLRLSRLTANQLTHILTTPGAEVLSGLSAYAYNPTGADGENDALAAAIAASKTAANLERLTLNGVSVAGLRAFDRTLTRLRTLHLSSLSGSAADVPALARAGWFRDLRAVTVHTPERALQEPLTAALAQLPRLESLTLRSTGLTALKALGDAGGFPALARLRLDTPNSQNSKRLARGTFPRLAELTLPHLRNDDLEPLLRAKWFAQLRVLDVSSGYLNDKGAFALARSAVAPALRILRIGNNALAKRSLLALTDGARFPELTTLDARLHHYTQVRGSTVATVAAELSLPRVRHLHLNNWPLGDAGAKALAANPALANVTRLSLSGCKVGDRGLTALAKSPHLQGLIELDLSNNVLKTAAALLDPDRLPHLAAVNLSGNLLSSPARDKLHRARGWTAG
ncbi:MAG: TIGR02996 domain-containing protein [Gemmataceae bacterium]|nr:TIGR02996 domain-containing protein [Gemmataceae bacterium]